MLNEGIIASDARALVKSEMIRQLRTLGPTTPAVWERAVFKAQTGHDRDEVDWSVEDNQAGYFVWLKSFDQLIEELIEDGYVCVQEVAGSNECTFVPTETDPPLDWSRMAYPKR